MGQQHQGEGGGLGLGVGVGEYDVEEEDDEHMQSFFVQAYLLRSNGSSSSSSTDSESSVRKCNVCSYYHNYSFMFVMLMMGETMATMEHPTDGDDDDGNLADFRQVIGENITAYPHGVWILLRTIRDGWYA